MISFEDFDVVMATKGWLVFNDVVDLDLIDQMSIDIHRAYLNCRSIQVQNGIDGDTSNTVHHLIGQHDSFLKYLEDMPIKKYIERYFGGKFILNSFGGMINKKNASAYANRIHRDIRSYSGSMPLILNTLVMLDDFTNDNGATWMLSGSHHKKEKPSEEYFWKNAEQASGKKGSILFFNSNVWHSGGENKTNTERKSVTPMFSKPFMKQQFDYPRVLGYDRLDNLDEDLAQILGYFSRVPASLEEWYQPPENRMYRPDQG